MKLTKKQKESIKKLKEEGSSPKEISKKLSINYSTVLYHYNPEVRKRKIKTQLKYQKNNPPKRTDKIREYQRNYHRERYWRLKKEVENE